MKVEHLTQYTKDYTVIHNNIFDDNRLNFKSKGIFGYLWHLPNDWTFRKSEIVKHTTDGISSLDSGIKPLKHFGYLKMLRQASGHVIWLLSDMHVLNNLSRNKITHLLKSGSKPSMEKPPMDNPSMAFKGDTQSTKDTKYLGKQSNKNTNKSLREDSKNYSPKINEKKQNEAFNQEVYGCTPNVNNQITPAKMNTKPNRRKQKHPYASNFHKYDNNGRPANRRTAVVQLILKYFNVKLTNHALYTISDWAKHYSLKSIDIALRITKKKYDEGLPIHHMHSYVNSILRNGAYSRHPNYNYQNNNSNAKNRTTTKPDTSLDSPYEKRKAIKLSEQGKPIVGCNVDFNPYAVGHELFGV